MSSSGECMVKMEKAVADSPVRNAVRFPIQLPVHVHTSQGEIEAVTENISANGLLFVADYLPAVDSKIEFSVTMPSEIMGSPKDVTIHCVGRVVRHLEHGDKKKAAVVIDEYFLRA